MTTKTKMTFIGVEAAEALAAALPAEEGNNATSEREKVHCITRQKKEQGESHHRRGCPRGKNEGQKQTGENIIESGGCIGGQDS